MQIDPRLNDIDDCLYRVVARVLVVDDSQVLLVNESVGGSWWALPGGGIDHGEAVEASCCAKSRQEVRGIGASLTEWSLCNGGGRSVTKIYMQ